MMATREVDTLILGGGVVGMAIAYGLAAAGERVRVIDEGDDALRAARGNFGLVWVQGKGLSNPDYARWSMAAAQRWPAFAQELAGLTDIDVELSQIGGLTMYLDERDLCKRAAELESLRLCLGGHYPFEMLSPDDLRAISPFVGPDVVGASFSALDGHVSPLRLLRALVQGFQSRGGELVTGSRAERIEHRAGAFQVWAGNDEHAAGRVVLAAGLGNRDLAPMVGLEAPVKPIRGQILVSERVQPFLRYPSLYVRQTGEGVVQIGDSKEDVGFDDGTTVDQLARIASRAIRCFPILATVNVVRTWGALRVMSPDGLPIYQASSACPGAFLVTCHSGITLASVHAGLLVDWMRTGTEPPEIRSFTAQRFSS
jgi:glycine/D-amino acid oxidase-like deaminating enzyme